VVAVAVGVVSVTVGDVCGGGAGVVASVVNVAVGVVVECVVPV
jgi:hypothetical protein